MSTVWGDIGSNKCAFIRELPITGYTVGAAYSSPALLTSVGVMFASAQVFRDRFAGGGVSHSRPGV